VKALVEECRKHSGVAVRPDEAPIAYLDRLAHRSRRGLVIIFDQFEEFYVNFRTEQQRLPFVKLVGACHRDASLSLKFLFSIPSDFLHVIPSTFDAEVPETPATSKRHPLRLFTEAQAADVIERSVRKANWEVQAGLSRRVARDLASHDTVLPSEMQIVGEQ